MLQDLLNEIDAFLAHRAEIGRPMEASTFGRLTVNDGKLVKRLHAGGQITVAKVEAIRAWMKADQERSTSVEAADSEAA